MKLQWMSMTDFAKRTLRKLGAVPLYELQAENLRFCEALQRNYELQLLLREEVRGFVGGLVGPLGTEAKVSLHKSELDPYAYLRVTLYVPPICAVVAQDRMDLYRNMARRLGEVHGRMGLVRTIATPLAVIFTEKILKELEEKQFDIFA